MIENLNEVGTFFLNRIFDFCSDQAQSPSLYCLCDSSGLYKTGQGNLRMQTFPRMPLKTYKNSTPVRFLPPSFSWRDVTYLVLITATILLSSFDIPYLTITSRERHKSAPYLRLKNSKRTSKCQVPEKPKSWVELAR